MFAVGGLNGWALTSLDLEGSAAVKMLLPAMAVRGRARSLHEARAAQTIDHSWVVPVNHIGEANGVPNIAMKLLKGQCLGARLDRGPVQTTGEVGRSGREIAEGLHGAHARRLVHRVLKPDNV